MKDLVKKISLIFSNGFWGQMLQNAMAIITGSTLSSVFNMISIVIILKILSPDEYGSFIIAQTYMGVIDTVLNFQSWQGVIRYGTMALNDEDENKLLATIKAGIYVDGITCILGALVGWILIEFVASLFSWTETIVYISKIFLIEMVFHLEGTIVGFFKLTNKFNYLAIYTGWSGFVRLAIVVILYILNVKDVIVFTKIIVISDIVKYISLIIVALFVLNKMYGVRRLLVAKIRDVEKEFWNYTFWTNLDSSADVPIKYFDIFFLSLISNEIVAAYNLFKKYMSVFEMLIGPISQTIMPQFARLVASTKKENAFQKMKKLRNIIFVMLIPVFIIFILTLPFIMRLLGQESYFEYYYINYALAIYYICTLSYVGLSPLFSAYGFAKESTKITLISNIVYTVVAILLLSKFQIIGIIIAGFIQFFITVIWKQRYIQKELLQCHKNK